MSSADVLENIALRGKLLCLLKKGIPQEILGDIQCIIEKSGKETIIANKVDKILGGAKQDKLLHSYVEWVAAYVIVHEQKTLEELIETHKSSIIKHQHNTKLSEHIKKMIYDLNNLISELFKQMKEIRNDNAHDDMIRNIEKTSSIIGYLVNKLDEIEKENKYLLDEICASKESIRKTVVSILEGM
jgi:hypothetical protein